MSPRVLMPLVVSAFVVTISATPSEEKEPNILWITNEDTGPHLGAYGFGFADTPNLDALAAEGMIYTNAWSNAPVCAPARTTIITGVYANSLGAEHMRTFTKLPPEIRMSPQLLREAGYYCTNNVKEDYNVAKPGQVWDDSSKQAHWRNRASPAQPFYAVFNFTMTHESQIRKRPHNKVHDPAKVPLPKYHPDAPEIREDWAQYHDKITEMDTAAGKVLEQLEEDGLAEETIVFYFSDHGPGLPRLKRWPYDGGERVPLIVRIPAKYGHLAPEGWNPGGTSDRMVGFVDLAPTLLSLAGLETEPYMQGSAFLGKFLGPEREYNYGFTGRNGERYDFVRSIRDKRYIYIRNYHPHRPYGQHVGYLFETPTTVAWKRLYDQGNLEPHHAAFWEAKPPEELYDLQVDPDEIHNLVGSTEHEQTLERMRGALREWVFAIRDVSYLPESEIYTRGGELAPYTMGHDETLYPIERIVGTAESAASLGSEATMDLVAALSDEDSAVRYWGAMGLVMRGAEAVDVGRNALRKGLEDSAPSVRVVAAEALGTYGSPEDIAQAVKTLVTCGDAESNGVFLALMALNALDYLGEKARPFKKEIEALPDKDSQGTSRIPREVLRLKTSILERLQ